MQQRTTVSDRPAQQNDNGEAEVLDLGDAVELTEGTSSRSGSEDKRYKYR